MVGRLYLVSRPRPLQGVMQLVLHQEGWLRLVVRSLLVGRSRPLQGFPQPVLHQEGWLRLAGRSLSFFKKTSKSIITFVPTFVAQSVLILTQDTKLGTQVRMTVHSKRNTKRGCSSPARSFRAYPSAHGPTLPPPNVPAPSQCTGAPPSA